LPDPNIPSYQPRRVAVHSSNCGRFNADERLWGRITEREPSLAIDTEWSDRWLPESTN